MFGEPQCHCILCVKNGPASLKSQWVNKLGASTCYQPYYAHVQIKTKCDSSSCLQNFKCVLLVSSVSFKQEKSVSKCSSFSNLKLFVAVCPEARFLSADTNNPFPTCLRWVPAGCNGQSPFISCMFLTRFQGCIPVFACSKPEKCISRKQCSISFGLQY